MARDMLTIPVSSVSSEQAFSSSGRILEERRCRLSSELLEALMCVKDWEHARQRTQQIEEDTDLISEFGNVNMMEESGASNTL